MYYDSPLHELLCHCWLITRLSVHVAERMRELQRLSEGEVMFLAVGEPKPRSAAMNGPFYSLCKARGIGSYRYPERGRPGNRLGTWPPQLAAAGGTRGSSRSQASGNQETGSYQWWGCNIINTLTLLITKNNIEVHLMQPLLYLVFFFLLVCHHPRTLEPAWTCSEKDGVKLLFYWDHFISVPSQHKNWLKNVIHWK